MVQLHNTMAAVYIMTTYRSHMIWEGNIPTIVMLTRIFEGKVLLSQKVVLFNGLENKTLATNKYLVSVDNADRITQYLSIVCIELYWPENAYTLFVPCPGSPLVIEQISMLPFAEFVFCLLDITDIP